MKKSIIIVLLTVLSFSFASAGFAAAKKTAAEAQVNPLLGTWSFSKGLANLKIRFTADKAFFTLSVEGDAEEAVEMKYKFSKTPLILEYKAPNGKTVKLSMKYTIKGDKLTYRFLETKEKPVPGLSWEFSQERVGGSANKKDADTVAEKKEERTEMTSDKPAETKKDDKKPADVVLVKGVRLRICEKDIKENGTFTMENVWIAPVKNGKFDIILPAVPDFGATEKDREFHFFRGGMFRNSGAPGEHVGGLGDLSVTIIYSEKDGIKNSDFTDKPVTFKKGWNIIGNQKNVTVELQCRGRN